MSSGTERKELDAARARHEELRQEGVRLGLRLQAIAAEILEAPMEKLAGLATEKETTKRTLEALAKAREKAARVEALAAERYKLARVPELRSLRDKLLADLTERIRKSFKELVPIAADIASAESERAQLGDEGARLEVFHVQGVLLEAAGQAALGATEGKVEVEFTGPFRQMRPLPGVNRTGHAVGERIQVPPATAAYLVGAGAARLVA